MSITATLAFIVGLLLGIAIDARSRRERDQRIKELESMLKDSAPVRVCDDSPRSVEINN